MNVGCPSCDFAQSCLTQVIGWAAATACQCGALWDYERKCLWLITKQGLNETSRFFRAGFVWMCSSSSRPYFRGFRSRILGKRRRLKAGPSHMWYLVSSGVSLPVSRYSDDVVWYLRLLLLDPNVLRLRFPDYTNIYYIPIYRREIVYHG